MKILLPLILILLTGVGYAIFDIYSPVDDVPILEDNPNFVEFTDFYRSLMRKVGPAFAYEESTSHFTKSRDHSYAHLFG